MKELISFLKPYKKQVIIGPIFKLMEAIFELIIPIIMASLIDVGVANNDTGYIIKMSVIMFLLAATGLGCALVCQYSASVASQGYGTILRNHLFAHINSFSYAELDSFGVASLSTRITNDVNQLQVAVAMLIRLAIRAPFLCIGGLISAMIIDMKLAIVMVITIIIFVIVLPIIMSKTVKLYRAVQKRLEKMAVIAGENLSGVRVIRAFDKTEQETQRFDSANADHQKAAKKAGRLSMLSNPLTTFIMNMSILAIIWFGGARVNSGSMTQGEIIAFINYTSQILLALIVTANLVVLFTKAIASAGRVSEIMAVTPSVTFKQDALELGEEAPSVEFCNVDFAFNGSAEKALSGINFKATQGTTTGIIGLTGSGKTVLISLIARMYDATSGEVLINSKNVRDISKSSLRKNIAVVPQKTTLFSGTIASNVAFGNESATQEDILCALDTAQANQIIERIPEGINARVERGGTNLSGGQRQRIAIARALAMKPSILILDDCASALDFLTEARLRKALKKNTDEMTVFIVSQRVASVIEADNIIVLDDGEIIAQGTHNKLLKNCDTYREIFLSQTKLEEGKNA